MRGKASDVSARIANEARLRPMSPVAARIWQAATYAMAMPIPNEVAHALNERGLANLGNRWRPGHGKRHPWRRRKEPYWGEKP